MNHVDLTPGLLLSMPHLVDPNFTRAVVLMIEHADEGSFGLIINQPSTMTVTTLLGALELTWQGEPEALVWSGGPVMPTSGWVLHEPTGVARATATSFQNGLESGDTIAVGPGLALSTSPEALKAIASAPPPRTRFLLGYSGWGPGQLASEIARGSWLHASADPHIIFDTPPDEMWESALRSIGVDPEAVVQSSGIH